jgi:hypothetical protein
VRAQRLADRKCRLDFLIDRLDADLELEQMEAFGPPCVRFIDVLIRRRITQEPHRPHGAAPLAANQIDDAPVEYTTREVQKRHLDRRMRAGVADQRARHDALEVRTRVRILADEKRRQVVAHGRDEPSKCVARHGRRGGGLAEAHGAALGLDADQHVFRGRDRDARHGHGRLERQRDRNGVDAADDQRRMLKIGADVFRLGEHAQVLKRGSR